MSHEMNPLSRIHSLSHTAIKIMKYELRRYPTREAQERFQRKKNVPSINKENNDSCLRQMIDSERKRNGKKEMIPYSNFHGVRFFPLSRQRSVLFPFVICRFALCTEDVWILMKRELVSWPGFFLSLPFLFPPLYMKYYHEKLPLALFLLLRNS